jgi:hypothetical protein
LPIRALHSGVNDDQGDGDWDYQPSDFDEDPTSDAVDSVDPGDPAAENVAFVVLGALLTLFVLGRVAGLV